MTRATSPRTPAMTNRHAVPIVLAIALLLSCIAVDRADTQRTCRQGKPCGNSCIAADKVCRMAGEEQERPSAVASERRGGTASSRTADGAAGTRCRVTRVVDGDTMECGRRRIRLLLIDTPERSQAPFGGQATAALRRLAPVGSTVRLEFDIDRSDRYGRELAYVHAEDGRFINEAMAREGFAVPLVYPPNVRYVERIRAAVEAAKAARVGLWAVDAFTCLPSDARRGRCR